MYNSKHTWALSRFQQYLFSLFRDSLVTMGIKCRRWSWPVGVVEHFQFLNLVYFFRGRKSERMQIYIKTARLYSGKNYIGLTLMPV